MNNRQQKIKWNIPNSITMLRIFGTMFLLLLQPFSVAFFVIYTITGVTDMLDGCVCSSLHDMSACCNSNVLGNLCNCRTCIYGRTAYPSMGERVPNRQKINFEKGLDLKMKMNDKIVFRCTWVFIFYK